MLVVEKPRHSGRHELNVWTFAQHYGKRKMNERNAEIIRLWNLEIPSKDIAAQLGITKNAVIGVVTRERESGRGLITRSMKPGSCQNMKNEKRPHKKRPGAEQIKVRTMPKLFQIEAVPEKRQTKVLGVALDDLGHHSCRYPTSRVSDQHYFCGEPTRDAATSYCAIHHPIVWLKRKRLTPEQASKLKKMYAEKQWLNGASAAQLKGKL